MPAPRVPRPSGRRRTSAAPAAIAPTPGLRLAAPQAAPKGGHNGYTDAMLVAPPLSETELLARAQAVAGRCLASLAGDVGVRVPRDLRRHKGWVGELLERLLGATSASLPEPDFPALGVELKTLPVGRSGLPRESTYVCTVPLEPLGERWATCWVRRKLARVLWVPVEAEPQVPLRERRIGMPLLWSPSVEEETLLRHDWEELMELVGLGGLERITARHGTALQIRPKAANGRALTTGVGPDGAPIATLPRGFYLRAAFTTAVLHRHYILPGAGALSADAPPSTAGRG